MIKKLKAKILAVLGVGAGGIGLAGAWGACHTICMAAIAALAAVGITVTGMPLAFAMDPKFYIPFLVVGIALIGASVYMWQKQSKGRCVVRKKRK
ncbi:MAG: hypothetical protein QW331_02975 [Candidatus Woesearchaeota archaeon]